MNQKQLEAVLVRAREVLAAFPPGKVVWHIADGKRGVVDGAKICGDGAVLPSVTWPNSAGLHYEFELRGAKVPENWDGEEWKAGLDEPPAMGG